MAWSGSPSPELGLLEDATPSWRATKASSALTLLAPKNSKDATATLAAPKWYFLMEKRVNFSPGCFPNFMKCSPFFMMMDPKNIKFLRINLDVFTDTFFRI